MSKNNIKFLISMFIFGSIGIFVRKINLPSEIVVTARTVIGSIFLISLKLIGKNKLNLDGIKKNLILLLISGCILAGGWVLLFEAYRYTTVSSATLIYYSAPIFVFILSPLIFKEKIKGVKLAGIFLSFVGLVIINDVGVGGVDPIRGVIAGLLSAVTYALIMIFNKLIKDLDGFDTTLIQILIAAIVMIVLMIYKGGIVDISLSGEEIFLLLIVGIVHTGIACYLYFSSMAKLPAQNIAVMSYLDPATALFLSYIFLNEKLTMLQLIGGAMIFIGTAISQYESKENKIEI